MGERSRIMRGKRRTRLYALVAAAYLAFFGVLFLGVNVFGAGDGLLGRITAPVTTSDRDPTSDFAADELQRAAEQEANFLASGRQAAAEQAAKETKEAVKKETPEQRPDEGTAQPAIPSDTTMYLTVPKLGLYDIPVLEGRSEAVLSQGVGHLPGTGSRG